jgi:hypothetical protein
MTRSVVGYIWSPEAATPRYCCYASGKASEAIKEADTAAKEPSHVRLSLLACHHMDIVGSKAHYES